MELDDRLVIATPEGVELELMLAGLGSRAVGGIVDGIIQVVVIVATAVVVSDKGGVGEAIFAIVAFLMLFAYNVLFEVWGGGRTPGKHSAGLRVVRSSGASVGLGASALRTVIRLIDLLPGVYVVGSISILVTKRNQRLGDLAADTIVV